MRFLLVLAFAFVLAIGCVLEPNRPFTYRPIDMSNQEFVEAANAIVLDNTPEWHVTTDGPDIRVIVKTVRFKRGYYARVYRMSSKLYLVFIENSGLELKSIEDLASVLLHEYVHIKTWDSILALTDLSTDCKEIRSELLSEMIVVNNFYRIGYTKKMLHSNLRQYRRLKMRAKSCPPETISGLPEWPLPVSDDATAL